ncbi:uncharacterized protein BKA55DRAFT_535746 [Fusarium redolens]|uniref:Uncharacterized protein n=1 Tax=Fusarium redolens TaxID=48865 RepID=A0A9P9HN64_FUSRE|nr:uncharacterized protein BKA55DRAFT_535746 [Fusarium redolens]KAH7260719.1 hypothetical protein BKA55DRAFT_535746 [Fusarium redolens]
MLVPLFDPAKVERISKHHRNFKSLMRILDVNKQHPILTFPGTPAWIDQHMNYDDVHHENAARISGLVADIPDSLVDHERPSVMDSPASLSRYCSFGSEKDLNSYVDIIIPDIVQTAALVAFNCFQPSIVADDINKLSSGASKAGVQPTMQEFKFESRMRGYYTDLKTAIERYKGNVNKTDMPSPATILAAYENNPRIRRFVNEIACLCTSPTFIPALNKHISKPVSKRQGNKICPEAFVPSHAIQIMLFAAQKWDPKCEYSRDHKYPHRFPFCNTLGFGYDPDGDVCDRLCTKNVRRAILLFYYLIKRRDGSSVWIGNAPNNLNAGFSGHSGPDAEDDGPPTPRIETAPAVPNEHAPVNGVDVVTDNNESDESDEDEDEDADAPESVDETETIEGLSTIRINTLLLESFITTRPSESLSQRLRGSGEPESPPISFDKLRKELHFLLEHHMQPEFESLLSTSTKHETQVPFDLAILDMKHLIKCPFGFSANSEVNQSSRKILVDLGYGQSPGHESRPNSNLPEHRKAVLISFDWRNKIVLELEEPPFLATVATAKAVMKQLLNPEIEEDWIKEHDETRHAPTERIDCIRWVCYYNPIMTRALELAYKYCREDKERLVVYVEDPWIQCIAVALFVVAGFNVGTIRSSDTTEEQFKIMNQWKNKASRSEILVANVDTKIRYVNMHTSCTKGLLLNWTLEPERMLKIINNMVSTNQKKPSTFHMLKVADTYHDVIERVCCTRWAMQLSGKIEHPEWMTGVVREICTWHQRFNRYAWVVTYDLKGHDFKYHDPEWRQPGNVFSIVAKLMLHHPRDKEFWVESMPILIELCFHFRDAFDKSDYLEDHLRLTPKEMRKSLLPMFKGMKNARAALNDEQASERREVLQRGVEARAKMYETGAQVGVKRKASEDGEGGAKRQRTSAA